METTTELTRLLHESRHRRKELLEQRDYAAAKELRESTFRLAADRKAEAESVIRERHAIERRRLQAAKEIALQKIHDAVTAEVAAIDAETEELHQELLKKQSERLEQFKRRVETQEAHRPAVMSSYIRDLQQSEKKLAVFHMYDECAQVRRKIRDQEEQEKAKLEDEKHHRVDSAIARKRAQFDNDEGFFRARAKNLHQLALFRAQQEEERVRRQFEHTERDMEHAHMRELQQNVLLQAYQTPKFIHLPPRDNATSASTRGTTYMLRMHGSRFEIPSLCDLYGNELDNGSAQRFAASAGQHNHWHNSSVGGSKRSRGASSTSSSSSTKLAHTLPAMKPSTPKTPIAGGRTRVS